MIDVHYASLTSQGVQHRVFYLDGHPSRYQPRPTGLNFGEQTGTGVFPLVVAVPIVVHHNENLNSKKTLTCMRPSLHSKAFRRLVVLKNFGLQNENHNKKSSVADNYGIAR